MGTDYRQQEKRHLAPFRKVSKPLMEKKRRARINVSLEQLKALLEKHYSHQIRKRKLEKADILELSVKYMKSLQHSVQGAPALLKSADYQAGFRSCLQGVRQFLLGSEAASERAPSFQRLHELARALPLDGSGFSTTDSGPAESLSWQPQATASRGKPSSRARATNEVAAAAAACSRAGHNEQALAAGSSQERLWRPWS